MGNNGQGPDGELAMKIDAHRHTQDTHATDGTRRADNDAGVAPGGRLAGAGASDRVELSGDAALRTAALKAANEAPSIRTDLVDRMRERLAHGQIGTDSTRLADAILNDILP